MKVSLSVTALFLVVALAAGCKQEPAVVDLADSGWAIAEVPTVSGKEPMTIADLSAAGWTITPASISDVERILGNDDSDLAVFKSKFENGDTVVRLVAPSNYWANLAGWDGYAIVRSGTVVATLVHILS